MQDRCLQFLASFLQIKSSDLSRLLQKRIKVSSHRVDHSTILHKLSKNDLSLHVFFATSSYALKLIGFRIYVSNFLFLLQPVHVLISSTNPQHQALFTISILTIPEYDMCTSPIHCRTKRGDRSSLFFNSTLKKFQTHKVAFIRHVRFCIHPPIFQTSKIIWSVCSSIEGFHLWLTYTCRMRCRIHVHLSVTVAAAMMTEHRKKSPI